MIGLVLPRSAVTCRSTRAPGSASPASGSRPSAERMSALASAESFRSSRATGAVIWAASFACSSRSLCRPSRTGLSIHLASRSSASSAGGSKATGGVLATGVSALRRVASWAEVSGWASAGMPSGLRPHPPTQATAASQSREDRTRALPREWRIVRSREKQRPVLPMKKRLLRIGVGHPADRVCRRSSTANRCYGRRRAAVNNAPLCPPAANAGNPRPTGGERRRQRHRFKTQSATAAAAAVPETRSHPPAGTWHSKTKRG